MRFQILIFCTILTFIFLLSGCPSNPPTNSASNANQTIVNNPNKPTNSGSLETSKTPTETTVNEAPTLKPVFTAYCDAMTKKDEAALRKVFSQGTLKSLEADMKADNQKSLVKYLEVERVSNKLCEVRNEKIEGETGVAEVKTEGMPNGAKIKFVRENGEWKLTTEIPDFKAVKDSVQNANTAK
jgi:PBP1b-binding outer membrane lipoprotein LpoB